MRYCIATGKLLVPQFHSLKGLCHPTRMREPMKTNLKKSARLFQVLSEILEGCFYLSKVDFLHFRAVIGQIFSIRVKTKLVVQ